MHPLQTEVIDYVTQRTESMMALAYFATLYLALRGMTAGAARGRWYAAAVASCALGMMCKESMVTAPVMVLLFDAVFVAGSLRAALRTRPGLYAGLAATWMILAALIVSGPRSNSAGFSSGVDAWTYFLNQGPLVLQYLRRAVLPVSLVFDYGLPRPIAMSTALPSLIVVGLLAMATLVAWRKNRRVAFLGTWFFVTLAPSSSFVPIATEVGAERRMYLPLAALVVLVVGVARRLPVRREILAGALAIVVGVFGVLTWQRNAEYRSGLVLWQTVVDRYPHGGAHYGLAMALKDAGRAEESFREMEIAAADFPEAEYALGFELASKGRHAEAAAHLRRYVQLKPADLNVLRAYNLLGRSLLASDDPAGAAAAFRDTLQRNPGNADALAGLGDALLRQQQYAEAVDGVQELRQGDEDRRQRVLQPRRRPCGATPRRRGRGIVRVGGAARTQRRGRARQARRRAGRRRTRRGRDGAISPRRGGHDRSRDPRGAPADAAGVRIKGPALNAKSSTTEVTEEEQRHCTESRRSTRGR